MERVSTLMDGELAAEDAEREIVRLKSDVLLRENWETYHLIGDALRGTAEGATGFSARFSERLALEPTVLAPRAKAARGASGKLQKFALPAMATAAAVAVVGWMYGMNPGAPTLNVTPGRMAAAPAPVQQSEIAAKPENISPPAPEQVAVATPPEPMQNYMLAHQGISPTTAFQGVAPYIRTVSVNDE